MGSKADVFMKLSFTLFRIDLSFQHVYEQNISVLDVMFKFVHTYIDIKCLTVQALWRRLSFPWKLGDE